jgi:hypothetical protein
VPLRGSDIADAEPAPAATPSCGSVSSSLGVELVPAGPEVLPTGGLAGTRGGATAVGGARPASTAPAAVAGAQPAKALDDKGISGGFHDVSLLPTGTAHMKLGKGADDEG